MPAIDNCEPQIRRALQKEGWVITDQPYPIRLTNEKGYVLADLRIEKLQLSQQIIVVEVKCFPPKSKLLDELYRSIGQYIIYRTALKLRGLNEDIYLALPLIVYQRIIQRPVLKTAIREYGIKLIVVDLDNEVIVSWLD